MVVDYFSSQSGSFPTALGDPALSHVKPFSMIRKAINLQLFAYSSFIMLVEF